MATRAALGRHGYDSYSSRRRSPCERALARQVLRHLERAEVGALLVPQREVADVGEAALEVDPELGHVLPARAEVGEDALHDVDAPRRVAVLHQAPEDRLRPREDAVLALAEEAHAVLRVDEGDVHRQRGEDGLELVEAERAGGEDDEALADRLGQALAAAPGRGAPAMARGTARAPAAKGPGANAIPERAASALAAAGTSLAGGRRLVAVARVDEAVAELRGLREDLAPLGLGQVLERHRQQDALLLEDHLLDRRERRLGDGLAPRAATRRRCPRSPRGRCPAP